MRAWLAGAVLLIAMTGATLAGAGQNVTLDIKISGKLHAPGAAMDVTLTVQNAGKMPVRLVFRSSQRFEIKLEEPSGREIWRWSRGRMFAQSLGQETLMPGQESLRYKATIPAPARPGKYVLRGRITSSGPPLEASAEILVH